MNNPVLANLFDQRPSRAQPSPLERRNPTRWHLDSVGYYLVHLERNQIMSTFYVQIHSHKILLTLAAVDEYGSSNVAQIRGLIFCQHDSPPRWNTSSRPNFFMMSSSVGLSVSRSSRSRIWSVSCVSRCVVYVIQQHGSTWLASSPQNSSSSSKSGPQTSAG